MIVGELVDDEPPELVDGLVDPLAGLRGAEDDDFGAGDAGTLDLGEEYAEETGGAEDGSGAGSDDLLADADRLSERNEPVEASNSGSEPTPAPAPAPSGGEPDAGSGGGGSTLFERMANLSRSSTSDEDGDEDDEDDDGPALSIPRFLGRQNNQ